MVGSYTVGKDPFTATRRREVLPLAPSPTTRIFRRNGSPGVALTERVGPEKQSIVDRGQEVILLTSELDPDGLCERREIGTESAVVRARTRGGVHGLLRRAALPHLPRSAESNATTRQFTPGGITSS